MVVEKRSMNVCALSGIWHRTIETAKITIQRTISVQLVIVLSDGTLS